MIVSRLRGERGKRNPYVGPRPFRRTDQLFFGRSREEWDLTDLLIAERIVLLHSPSGAGKTSLVQARVVPSLQESGFSVTPLLRVSAVPPNGARIRNRYTWSAVSALAMSMQDGELPAPAVDDLADVTLSEFLDRYPPEGNGDGNQVLVFDQFEELLTLDPTDWLGQGEFFVDLAQALDDPRRWLLLSMREDYMGGLDRYKTTIPTHLDVTYRIDFLERPAAMTAVRRPAEEFGVDFEEGAAQHLVEDLAKVLVQAANEPEPTPVPGPYVEPAQLQVVCYDLWQQLAEERGGDFTRVTLDDVQRLANTDRALARYYSTAIARVVRKTKADERAIRDWFGERLITEQGYRSQWFGGPDVGKATSAVLEELQARYLVRSDQRGAAMWFELTHDRLIDPVREDNRRWRQENLPAWDLAATVWERSGHKDVYLLTGRELGAALGWLRQRKPGADSRVREFVERSKQRFDEQKAQQGLRARARRAGQLVRLLVIVNALLLLSCAVMTYLLLAR